MGSQRGIPDIIEELQNLCLHCLWMGGNVGVDDGFMEMFKKDRGEKYEIQSW